MLCERTMPSRSQGVEGLFLPRATVSIYSAGPHARIDSGVCPARGDHPMSETFNGIYLDYAATTPADPKVAHAMAQVLTRDGVFGNPHSSSHRFGQTASRAVETARRDVAHLIGADEDEIVWTSGATESINLALKGVMLSPRAKGGHLLVSALEHKAVLDTAESDSSGKNICLCPIGNARAPLLSTQTPASTKSDRLIRSSNIRNATPYCVLRALVEPIVPPRD